MAAERNSIEEVTNSEICESKTGISSFNLSQLWQLITNIGDKPSDDESKCITILGKTYEKLDEFESDLKSKIWISYRFGFEPIMKAVEGPSPISFAQSLLFNKNILIKDFQNIMNLVDNESFTNDVGWGCMIRTSQSLLANALLLLMGLDPKAIVELFVDNSQSPFSLHNFIKIASDLPLEIRPGQWFGPSAASLSIKRLCDRFYESGNTNIPRLKVLISESCDLYDSKINEILNSEESDALLILLPIRLGIDKINSIYHPSLFHLLSIKQSVGIAGGRPSSSFYFIGFENLNLIYLDPHSPQQFQIELDYESYHTLNYQKLSINDLDPSMMIGILVNDLNDYIDFKESCLSNANKIIHFHAQEQDSPTNSSRKDIADLDVSDFSASADDDVISIESFQEGEDFVDVSKSKDVKENNSFEDGENSQYDHKQQDREVEITMSDDNDVSDLRDDVVNISHSISDNYEHIDPS
ncbi:uncharacterized protein PRCAT00003203001 [Priceomyces carsonii]|uniref:uncharacterized protein n=1 Tax=Priceomyces carsonii TaxID=28549 RepID=UPI002ED92238|nr:unnamed protein product [Priceomyces carsonii]